MTRKKYSDLFEAWVLPSPQMYFLYQRTPPLQVKTCLDVVAGGEEQEAWHASSGTFGHKGGRRNVFQEEELLDENDNSLVLETMEVGFQTSGCTQIEDGDELDVEDQAHT